MNTITKDFKGLPIVFREDGYINMTKAAKHYMKKDVHEFVRLPSTIEYIGAMQRTGIFPDCNIIQAKRGGRKGEAGTWCHPKLAVLFARWLSVDFAVWCDLMIDNILHGTIQTSVVVPTKEALDLQAVVKQLQAKALGLEKENKALKEQVAQEAVPEDHQTAYDFLCKTYDRAFARDNMKTFGGFCSEVARARRSKMYSWGGKVGRSGGADKE